MSRRDEGLAEIAVERRLLQDVCDLVRPWEGRPPPEVLDAVLSGRPRAVVSCVPGPRQRLPSPGRRRSGPGGSTAGPDPVRRPDVGGLPSAPR